MSVSSECSHVFHTDSTKTECGECKDWRCVPCTLVNSKDKSVCSACQTKRGAHTWPQEFGNCFHAEHKSDVTMEFKQKDDWQCLSCTLENSKDKSVCSMCKTKRGAHTCPLPQEFEKLEVMSLAECPYAEQKEEASMESQQTHGWKCLACTFLNRDGETKCHLCKTKKGDCKTPLRQEYDPRKDDIDCRPGNAGDETRVVVMGTSRDAKVDVANLLLNQQVFSSSTRSNHCEIGHASVTGKPLLVVYAPALFDTSVDDEAMNRELWRMVSLAAPGPHVFLYVEDKEATEVDEMAMDTLVGLFGKDVLKATVQVVLGGSENAENTDQMGGKVSRTVHLSTSCSSQHGTLLEAIEAVIKENGNSHFKQDLFTDAETVLQQRRQQQMYGDGSMKKLKQLEEDMRKLNSERKEDAGKIAKLKKELRMCKAQLKEQEEKLREKDRNWLAIDDKTLDQIIKAIKEIGGFFLPMVLSFWLKKK